MTNDGATGWLGRGEQPGQCAPCSVIEYERGPASRRPAGLAQAEVAYQNAVRLRQGTGVQGRVRSMARKARKRSLIRSSSIPDVGAACCFDQKRSCEAPGPFAYWESAFQVTCKHKSNRDEKVARARRWTIMALLTPS